LIASRPTKFLATSSAAAAALFADGGELICDLTTASGATEHRLDDAALDIK